MGNIIGPTWRSVVYCALGLAGASGNLLGQMQIPAPFGNSHLNGLQFYGINSSATYLHTPYSSYGGATPLNPFGSDYLLTLGTSVGWTKAGTSSNFSVIYSPSYFRSINNSGLSRLNHQLSINLGSPRKLSRRWTFNLSAAGALTDVQSFLFSSNDLGSIVSTPATFDQISDALTSRTGGTNDALAGVVNGASTAVSPLQTLFQGDRVATMEARSVVTYAHSPRLSITFGLGGARTQSVSRHSDPKVPRVDNSVPFANSATALVELSYSLNPRTSIGLYATTARSFTQRGQDSYASTANFFVGRKMGRKWFTTVHSGSALNTPVGIHLPIKPEYIYGGTLGLQAGSHMLLGVVDRGIGNSFGTGGYRSLSSSGVWSWARRGGNWSLYGAFTQQRVSGFTNYSADGWRANLGFQRLVGGAVVLNNDVAYMRLSGTFAPSRYRLDMLAVRLSAAWNPGMERQRAYAIPR